MRSKRIQKRKAAAAIATAPREYAPDLFGADIEGNEEMSELVEAEDALTYECPCCYDRGYDAELDAYERWYRESKDSAKERA